MNQHLEKTKEFGFKGQCKALSFKSLKYNTIAF